MAEEGSAKARGLQQAASVIFALVAVVPLLIFAWTLHTLGAIRSTQAQLSLGLALAVSLLGFWMFRSLLTRMAEVVQALAAAVEQASRMRRPMSSIVAPSPLATPAIVAPAVEVEAEPAAVAVAVAAAPAAASPRPAAAPAFAPPSAPRPAAPVLVRPTAAPARPASQGIAGIGKIRELTEVAATMDALWYREATAHLGQRVQISVANSREPLVGVLSEASGDGLILDRPEGALPVAYGRVTSIERLTA
ncbi:MAG TPA: hypothetical protein VHT71_22630 [Methylomirabilota bacterium]|jgi:hypothetical protein|nr:hypothetical protein [Methylomirabilota bacterium]